MSAYVGWAIVELMGHIRHVGMVREVDAYGGRIGTVEPLDPEGPKRTRFFGPNAVYQITPLADEAAARKAAGFTEPGPPAPEIEPGGLMAALEKAREARRAFAHMDEAAQLTFLKRELEKLTPGGSEFHNEPLTCLDHVREREESTDQNMRRWLRRYKSLSAAVDRAVFKLRNNIIPEVSRFHSLRHHGVELQDIANSLVEEDDLLTPKEEVSS